MAKLCSNPYFIKILVITIHVNCTVFNSTLTIDEISQISINGLKARGVSMEDVLQITIALTITKTNFFLEHLCMFMMKCSK